MEALRKPHRLASLFAATALAAFVLPANAQTLRVVGQSGNATKHVEVEQKYFSGLAAAAGLSGTVNFNTMDAAQVRPADALRLIRSGSFDVISTQIGQAARDDAFFEGIDLVGVATDVPSLRKSVEAFREIFDQRLQAKFNAKVMTIWPFGPQVIFCNGAIKGVSDLKGRKVRVFTASMAELVNSLGGTAVTMPAPEVYPALQRGVVECAITSPTSGNTSKWPELTNHFYPLGLSGSVQGHFMNLDTWKRLSPAQQTAVAAQFKKLEDEMWDLAVSSNADAVNCNIGADPCVAHTRYRMTMVPVSAADVKLVQEAAQNVVLPIFKKACLDVEPNCIALWNGSVGKAHGLAIR
jgi:TRAP-type C4-dicarboxylate transport system substrate-binding protein